MLAISTFGAMKAESTKGLRTAAALMAWCCCSAANAVSIAPVLVELTPARRVVSITIGNSGATPVSLQTQVLNWQQVGGVDQYGETADIIVVPPIAEVPAGGSQVFRVTTHLPPNSQEMAFRLIFEDVTEMTGPAADDTSMQVSLRINHNLPVFYGAVPPGAAAPRIVACQAAAVGVGCVRVENQGDHYAVIRSITLSSGEWRKELTVSTRVLAGAWRQWEFDLPRQSGAKISVAADTSTGPILGELP